MTTEEIINAAIELVDYGTGQHNADSPIECFKKGAEFMDKHWQEKTKWIPVNEKLPVRQSRTRQILGKDKHTVSVVFISCADEGYLNSLESLKREFTHWKEIE